MRVAAGVVNGSGPIIQEPYDPVTLALAIEASFPKLEMTVSWRVSDIGSRYVANPVQDFFATQRIKATYTCVSHDVSYSLHQLCLQGVELEMYQRTR